jgi:hypothetical protein
MAPAEARICGTIPFGDRFEDDRLLIDQLEQERNPS